MESNLLEKFAGKKGTMLPETLMFDHVSPATRLLEKRRQMFEVQEALNSQKEEFSRRYVHFLVRQNIYLIHLYVIKGGCLSSTRRSFKEKGLRASGIFD